MMAKTLGFRSWLQLRSQLQGVVSESSASRIRRAAFCTLHGQQLIFEAGIPNLEKKLREFERSVPIEEASTPPSSWYTDPAFAEFEMDRVFSRGWQAVGHIGQVEKPGDFFTGRVGKSRYVVCKNEEGQVQAFHNVCRHHAAAVASGTGSTHSFVCPYHMGSCGKPLDLQASGTLQPEKMGYYQSAPQFGVLLCSSAWQKTKLAVLQEKLGWDQLDLSWLRQVLIPRCAMWQHVNTYSIATGRSIVTTIWTVDIMFHMHIKHLLPVLTSRPTPQLMEKVSIQSCGVAESHTNLRVGRQANYAFVYPNFMINRYGPWMDTNLVLPISASQCRVVFDWFLEPSLTHDKDFIESSVKDSEVVQVEDITICEDVQDGLMSPAYDVGRYAPSVEQAMHHFHCLLYDGLSS